MLVQNFLIGENVSIIEKVSILIYPLLRSMHARSAYAFNTWSGGMLGLGSGCYGHLILFCVDRLALTIAIIKNRHQMV